MDGFRRSPWYEKAMILAVMCLIVLWLAVTWPFRQARRLWRRFRR